MQIVRNSGWVIMKDRTGNSYNFTADVQDFSCDDSKPVKEIATIYGYGIPYQGGAMKMSGKFKTVLYDPKVVNAYLSSTTNTTGRNIDAAYVFTGSAGTLPVSVTGTGIIQGLGAENANGDTLTLTASVPGAGYYTFNSGTGAFSGSAGDLPITLYFQYSTGTGQSINFSNPLQGNTNFYELHFQSTDPATGKIHGIKFVNAAITKLSRAYKLGEAMTQDWEFEAYASPTNLTGALYTEYDE